MVEEAVRKVLIDEDGAGRARATSSGEEGLDVDGHERRPRGTRGLYKVLGIGPVQCHPTVGSDDTFRVTN